MNVPQDIPNADLRAGDRVVITEWVKSKAYVRSRMGGPVIVQELVAQPQEADEDVRINPNQYLFGDVLEVVGVDYPWAVFTVHSARISGSDYSRWRIALDVREFNCREAKPEYLEAIVSGAPPKPEPAQVNPQLSVVRFSLAGLPSIATVTLFVVLVALAWRWIVLGVLP